MPDLGMSWKEALAYGEETSAKSHYIKDARLMAQQKYDLGRNSSWMFTKHGVPLQIRNMEKLKQFLDAGEQIHYQPVACYDGGDGSRTIQFFLNQIASDDAYKNVEVRTETRGVALLMSDERTVEGIQTKGADGLYVDISAKAVVLACGGMSNNLELLQNYSNQDLSHCVAVDQGHFGDGMVMAEQTAHGRCKTIALSSMLGYVGGFHYQSFLGLAAGDNPSALFVNQMGERFANEDVSRITVDEKVTGVIGYSKLIEGQGVVYSVMGRGLLDYYEQNGLFNAMGFYGNGQNEREFDLEAELGEYADNPNMLKADTLEELAEKMNVLTDAFVSCVERYDADAAAGAGDTLYGKDAQYMIALDEAPYYAFKLSSLIVNTNAGIRVNENCQVVDQAFVPVKGLYASGIAISGFVTDVYEVGNCQCVSIWSGSKAARTLVEQDLGGTVADDWYGDAEWSNDDRPTFSNWDAYEEWAGKQA